MWSTGDWRLVSDSEGAGAEVIGATIDALAFEALEEDLGQSLAVYPGWPQNMQSFSLKHSWHSSSVSLLSLPRWVGVAEVAEHVEVEDDGVDFFVGKVELVELGVEVVEVVNEVALEVDKAEDKDTGLTCLVISDLHSQYQVLIVWASMRRLWSVVGLLM